MVERDNKLIKKVDPHYIHISNRYTSLPAFPGPPDPIENESIKPQIKNPVRHQSHYHLKVVPERYQ